ncbi:DUF3515 domain-containing protein [Candidatus Mycobacterium wuenschmannii]|uniref:DUF3515 domain-containing protein n=1 Tax=Candidatus Mycobacterium wuenschmannii TaxID=3027808 RepID=A0ABY8VXM9_9MYCO|nr:DUF3515 domain-containing protein [Candidatus Mycobacterium wuenschmannii]WIM88232.1 DUF3515 domain-containing protein [Candidatus Mycobacterium wuenschmannii]
MAESDGPPRAALIAALAVAVGAIGVILAIAATRHHTAGPAVVAAVPAPQAHDPACRRLTDALPQRLGDYTRAQLAQPAPDGAAAWQPSSSGDAVVLRCGLERPADFVIGSPLQVVDNVQWFEVRQDQRSTWYTVDRAVYVALTLPPNSGPTPIQQLSELIDRVVPARPVDPARG